MKANTDSLRVNEKRLWETLMQSGDIGKGRSTGLCRLSLGDADKKMRDLFVRWCEEADCTISVDKVGNIFARRAGQDDALPPVVMGSHLDTQAAGGKYDGILGVLAGLEVIRALNDHRVETRRPLEVAVWTNEEGARFTPPMIASGAFAGVYDLDWVLAAKDDEGKVFGEELKRIGYAGDATLGGRDIDAYYELHIEQGPVLEAEDIDAGVVIGAYKSIGLRIDVRGETSHSGPTPMDQRRNALVGAAMLITATNDIGWEHFPEGKSTAPFITCWPNKPGILPDYAQITVDFRHPEAAMTQKMVQLFKDQIPRCAERANVDIEIVETWEFGSEKFDEECLATVREAADKLNASHVDILSQAGHDAYHMAKICPTALIFSPCHKGITHNEAEHIEPEYTTPSVNVLLHSVLKRANREPAGEYRNADG